MKKNISIIAMIITIANTLTAQVVTPATNLTTQERAEKYFFKSRHQKNAAWGLLGAGGALVLIGAATFPKDYLWWGNSKSTESKAGFSAAIAGVGGLAMLGSIPFFISSGTKKSKARLLMDTEKVYVPVGKGNVRQGKLGFIVSL